VRFGTLSELDTIDLYLVSMGRGQSDEIGLRRWSMRRRRRRKRRPF
jgi:hypothetical protein